MGYYKETSENGGCYISNLDARNNMEAAEALFAYITEIHQPIMDFYDRHPRKAADKTSWEREEVVINNLWKDAQRAAFLAKREWNRRRVYFGPGDWD